MINNSILKRLEKLENAKEAVKRRSYVFNLHEDFISNKAMQKEFSKEKYAGCTIILNDIE